MLSEKKSWRLFRSEGQIQSLRYSKLKLRDDDHSIKSSSWFLVAKDDDDNEMFVIDNGIE